MWHVLIAGRFEVARVGPAGLARGGLPRRGRRRRRHPPYQAGIWWPHHSWREMHQSWMLFSHWL